MHLVIPFAAPMSEAGRAALASLRLPALNGLLAQLTPTRQARPPGPGREGMTDPQGGDEYRLTPPHEQVIAQALGWQGGDGALPWAAHAAAADGIDTGPLAWGLLSPVHWQLGREHLTMGDPQALGLDADTSRAYLEALRPLFESEGWRCEWGAPTRWYVAHASLAALPTASLDRVIGRNPDLWMPAHPGTRALQRLLSEVQMLLHGHPLNEAREAAGREPLNSVWLSGCGAAQPLSGAMPQVLEALRGPALREDWPAWAAAWQALDTGPLHAALQARDPALTLSLCGERRALNLERRPAGLWSALRSRWQRRPAAALLESL
jgi:hypothetical protein